MDFALTFTLGDLIQVVSFVSVILLAWGKMNARMARIEERHGTLEEQHAKMEVRLNNVEERGEKEIKALRSEMAEGFKDTRKDMSDGLRRIYDKLDGKADK